MIRTIEIQVESFDAPEQVSSQDRHLLEEAVRAAGSSYSPYSGFRVGAALRLANGEIILGSNQENAAYPSGMCAERVALFYAQSHFPDVPVEAIAITAKSEEFSLDQPVTPCGSCRQVMAEIENRSGARIRVIMGNSGHAIAVEGISSLLPLMFVLEKLKKKKRS